MPVAKYYGIDSILTCFEKKAVSPYWALYQGSELHNQYTGDDMQESLSELQDELQAIRESGNNAVLCLYPHSVKLAKGELIYPKKDKKYPCAYPIYCSVFEKTLGNLGATGSQVIYAGSGSSFNNSAIDHRLKLIEDKISALGVEEDYPEEEEEPEAKTIGAINKLLENPLIQGIISAGIGYLTRNSQPTVGNQRVDKLGAISEEWEELLTILFQKGVTLEHLRKLAAMPQSKITMLLSML